MKTPIASRATPEKPCAVCGAGTKGCSQTEDGLHLCRGEPRAGWRRLRHEPDSAGFYSYRREAETPRAPKAATPRPPIDWQRKAEHHARDFSRWSDHLARRLKLPLAAFESMPLLGVDGVSAKGVTFTFPECDATGRITGIMRRFPPETEGGKEEKKAMAGSIRGLTLPVGWRERRGPALVTEGNTDPLALALAGLCAIGQPGAGAGVKLLAELFRDWPAERDIIVIGENDRKENGEWPGRAGAERTAGQLARQLRRRVGVAFPPDGAKDARAWLTAEGRHEC